MAPLTARRANHFLPLLSQPRQLSLLLCLLFLASLRSSAASRGTFHASDASPRSVSRSDASAVAASVHGGSAADIVSGGSAGGRRKLPSSQTPDDVALAERDALLAFKAAMGDHPAFTRVGMWTNHSAAAHPCRDFWQFIRCDGEGRVVAIDMSNPLLASIDLAWGKVSGGPAAAAAAAAGGKQQPVFVTAPSGEAVRVIGPLTGRIPWRQLAALERLESVNLEGNDVFGPAVTADVASLPNLKHIRLMFNRISGPLGEEVAALTALETLDLSMNRLSGPLPRGISSLVRLTSLLLANNQMVGRLPAEMGALTRLAVLTLGGNAFSGPLPSEWGQLANLKQLYLHRLPLSGSFPPSWSQMASLNRFVLTAARLKGEYPAFLTQLPNITDVILSSNQLHGSLPANLWAPTQLTYLDVSHNYLQGHVPAPPNNRSADFRYFSNCLTLSPSQLVTSGAQLPADTCGDFYDALKPAPSTTPWPPSASPSVSPSSLVALLLCLLTLLIAVALFATQAVCSRRRQQEHSLNQMYQQHHQQQQHRGFIFALREGGGGRGGGGGVESGGSVALPADFSKVLRDNHLATLIHFSAAEGIRATNTNTHAEKTNYGTDRSSSGSDFSPCSLLQKGVLDDGRAVFILNLLPAASSPPGSNRQQQQQQQKPTVNFSISLDDPQQQQPASPPHTTSSSSTIDLVSCSHQQFVSSARQLSRRTRHAGLLRLVGFCDDLAAGAAAAGAGERAAENEGCGSAGVRCLVFEHADGGSLRDRLEDSSPFPLLTWTDRTTIALSVARALEHLHTHTDTPAVHGHLSSLSVFVTARGAPKLAYLGRINAWLGRSNATATAAWSGSDDVRAFGALLLELLTGRHMTAAAASAADPIEWARPDLSHPSRQHYLLDHRLSASFPPKQLSLLCSVALACAQENAKHRPTMQQVAQRLSLLLDRTVQSGDDTSAAGARSPTYPAICAVSPPMSPTALSTAASSPSATITAHSFDTHSHSPSSAASSPSSSPPPTEFDPLSPNSAALRPFLHGVRYTSTRSVTPL